MATYSNSAFVMGGVQVAPSYNQLGVFPTAPKEYVVMQQSMQALAPVPQQRVMVPQGQPVWVTGQEAQTRFQQQPQVASYQVNAPMTTQPMVVQVQQQPQPQLVQVQQKPGQEMVLVNVNGVLRQGIIQNGTIYLLEATQAQPRTQATMQVRQVAAAPQPTPRPLAPSQTRPQQLQVQQSQATFTQNGIVYIQQQVQQPQVQAAARYVTAAPTAAQQPAAAVNRVPVQVQQVQYVNAVPARQPVLVNQQAARPVLLARPPAVSQATMPHIRATQPMIVTASSPMAQQATPMAGNLNLIQAHPAAGQEAPALHMGQPAAAGVGPAGPRMLATSALARGLTPAADRTAAMAAPAGARLPQQVPVPPVSAANGLGTTPGDFHGRATMAAGAVGGVASSFSGSASPTNGASEADGSSLMMFNPAAKASVGVIGDARRSREDGGSGCSTPKVHVSTPGSGATSPKPAVLPVVALPSVPVPGLPAMDGSMQQVWGVLAEEAKRCGVSLESLATMGGSPVKVLTLDAAKIDSGTVIDTPASRVVTSPDFNAFGFSFFGGAADAAATHEGLGTTNTAGSAKGLAWSDMGLVNLLSGLDLGETA